MTDEERAIVGEHAAKHGTAAAMRFFKQGKRFPNLKEATVPPKRNVALARTHNFARDFKNR